MERSSRIVIITGPTATGKTGLAIKLAQEFSGELISADSRQVYKYMDIGTGKDSEEYQKSGVTIWGIDIVQPDHVFSVAEWIKYTTSIINDIHSRGKLPIIVGGTGLYLKSLLYPPETMNAPVNRDIRERLLGYSLEELQKELIRIDRKKWESMNESDRNNPRRLVRAIEVAYQNKKYPEVTAYTALVIGLTASREVINERIDRRVEKRMKQGMIEEIRDLLAKGYSWDLPSMSGLGYQQFKFKKNLESEDLDEIISDWKIAEHQYAKRQMTYLKKYLPEAKWFDIEAMDVKYEVEKFVSAF